MTIDCTNLKPGDNWCGILTAFLDAISNEYDIVGIPANQEPEMDATTFPFSWRYRFGTLELSDFTFGDPAKITINGKQYVPAKDPSLCHTMPYNHTYTVSAITNEVVAITCNNKRFTPADSWPEPITNRQPTKEDADGNGLIQVLDSDGDWMRRNWHCFIDYRECGWARTSDWDLAQLTKKTLTIRDLKEAMRDGEKPDHDTLKSVIELLEATC
jgi:hypothetical protein